MKRDLMGITKSIDPDQPVQPAQGDHGRNFSLLTDFSFLPTELDIFDIQQHYIRILFIFQRLIC